MSWPPRGSDEIMMEQIEMSDKQISQLTRERDQLQDGKYNIETALSLERQLRRDSEAEIARLREELDKGNNSLEQISIAVNAKYGAASLPNEIEAAAWEMLAENAANRDELDRLRRSLEVLVNKLELVHNDYRYAAVWQIAATHGCAYTGPTYEAELKEAKRALRILNKAGVTNLPEGVIRELREEDK